MRLIFSLRSKQDLDSIFLYLNQISPAGAQKAIDAIQVSVGYLKDYPNLAPTSSIAGVRVQWVRGYKFQIFYRVEGEVVSIIHIRHTAREPFRPET